MSQVLSDTSSTQLNVNEIDVKEAWSIHYWCDELNLRAEELKEILKLVGPLAHDVRVHIAKKLILQWTLAY